MRRDEDRLRDLGVIVEIIPCHICGVETTVYALGFAAMPPIDTFRCDEHTVYKDMLP